jgi:hypothetical protein
MNALLIAALIGAAAAQRICVPKKFAADSSYTVSSQKYGTFFFSGHFAYMETDDGVYQRASTQVVPGFNNMTIMYANTATNSYYQVTASAGGSPISCVKVMSSDWMFPSCFDGYTNYYNATMGGFQGDTIMVSLYAMSKGKDYTRIMFHLESEGVGIPVNMQNMTTASGLYIASDVINPTSTVHASIFTPPSICNGDIPVVAEGKKFGNF